MYPTKDQILARPVTIRPSTVFIVQAWKRTWRGRRRSPEALGLLLLALSSHYRKPVRVTFERSTIGPHYNVATQTITLDPTRGSVVTALHEFAHHLYGRSEYTACRWSIWLFRQTFRPTYEACHWRGHLLVRRAR